MMTQIAKPHALPQLAVRQRPTQPMPVMTLPAQQKQLQVLPKQAVVAFQPKLAPTPPMQPLPKPNMFAAERATGAVSQLAGVNLTSGTHFEIELPFGTPRFIKARTLKILLQGRRTDTLLKLQGKVWTICSDDSSVDLQDKATQFRLGRIAVFS